VFNLSRRARRMPPPTGPEAAYIGHYHHLENNVQGLYRLTAQDRREGND
jgi:hypothetical protein